MVRTSSIVIAIGIIAGSGMVHGLLTDRWGLSDEPAASAAKLALVPKVLGVLGDWQGEDQELDPEIQEMIGIAGFLNRLYVNPRTGSQVHIFLVCGHQGSASVHSPEVCYEASGYKKSGLPTTYTESKENKFWWVKFVKRDAISTDQLRIFWAWNADGHWQAPRSDPRFAFFRYRALFKLYVIRHLADAGEPFNEESDAAVDLMRLLLPELQRCLFPET